MAHLSFSSAGGAGVVATRLANAQRLRGWDATLHTASSSDLASEPFAHPVLTISAALDEYVIKKSGFPSLFSEIRGRNAVLDTTGLSADVFHLHWVSGTLDLAKASFLKNSPVIWTLHDMNPFTGGCHHSFGCEGFIASCEECPAVRSFATKLPPARLSQKIDHYKTWRNLRVVAPSAWMAKEAARSSAFHETPVIVIPNPIDPLFFQPSPNSSGIEASIPDDNTVVILVAANLDDPIKNVKRALGAFQAAREHASSLSLVLVGRGGAAYSDVPGVILTGSLTTGELISLLDRADALLIPSVAENAPSVAFEAASRGVIPIVSPGGGLPEIISTLGFGVVCETDADWHEALKSEGLRAKSSMRARAQLIQRARELVDPATVASRYVELYEADL